MQPDTHVEAKLQSRGRRHVLGQVEITKMHCKHHAEGSLAYADVRGQVQKGEERGEGRPHIVGFVFWSHSADVSRMHLLITL